MFFIGFPILPYPIRPRATISIGYIKPCVKPSKSNVLSSYINVIISYGSNTLPWKSWVFKGNFSFKVRQHSQKQLYLQYKVCWILCKMVGAYSFSQSYLCIQPRQQSRAKFCFSTSFYFLLPIPLLLLHKIILTIPTNTPFLYTSVILHLFIFEYNLPNNLHQKYFHTSVNEPIQAASKDQEARKSWKDWHCFNISPSSSKYEQW